MTASLVTALEAIPDLKVRTDVPLAKLTTFKIGGPARVLITPGSEEALQRAVREIGESGLDSVILGNGSNFLISDAGFEGVVIRVGSALGAIEEDGPDVLRLGAGALWSRVLRFILKEGWTGLEFGAGIPGTLGGAIATNAGTRGGETADSLIDVRGVDRAGELVTLPKEEIPFVYRRGDLPEGFVVTSTRFRVGREDPAKVNETVRGYQAERRRDQPEREPSAGCMFKNPPGTSAGKLIDQAGLKGQGEGGVVVSEVHGNFFINRGDATASDVLRLMARVQEVVKREYGVDLEPEVRGIGVTL